MGWIFPILFAALLLLFMGWHGQISRRAFELTLAAMFIALLGYAWQGSPNVAGAPVEKRQ